MNLIFTLLAIIPLLCFSQNYNGPESVEYNSLSDSYFISNSNNGQIIELTDDNNTSVFANNLINGPHGLEIVENTLYACSGSRIKAFNIETGEQVLNFNIGANFLNGITHKIDESNSLLFITDFSARKLYEFNINTQEITELCSFDKNPNGIIYESNMNRLIIVSWGNNAKIYEFSLNDYSLSTLLTTSLGYLDGISIDQCGNFIVSSWSTNSIHTFRNNFPVDQTNGFDVITSNLNNPADIFYNQLSNTLAIPNSGNNTVDFFYYEGDLAGSDTNWPNLDCYSSNIDQLNKENYIVKSINLLGQKDVNKGFRIDIFNNGSIKKQYLFK